MGKWRGIALVVLAVLALGEGGCITSNTETEGDRQVIDQTEKAGADVVAAVEGAQDALKSGNVKDAQSLLEVGARAGHDIVENMKQQKRVHGAPKLSPPYSAQNSAQARKQSDDDHANGNWSQAVLGILGAAGGIAVTLLGMPWLAQVFPVLTGQIGKMAKAYVGTINDARAAAEANGGQLDLGTLLTIAKDKNVQAGIQDIVAMHAHAHEEARGMNLTSLESIQTADATETAPAAAETAPTP